MNNRQLAAIYEVEEAMKKLKASGLILAGVDATLVVFRKRQYYKLPKNQWGVLPAPSEALDQLDYFAIDCPYVDSGGM